MRRLLLFLVVVAAVAGLIVAFVAGRKEVAAEAQSEKPIEAPGRLEVVNGENLITLDATARARSGIVLAPLQTLTHRAEISAYGTLVDPGELTDLRSTLANAHAQLAKAEAALTVARQDYERVKGLFDSNQNVSQKTLQAAAGTLRTEESNVQAAQAADDAARATAQQRWGAVVANWLSRGGTEFDRLRRQEDLLVRVTLSPSQGAVAAPPTGSVKTASGGLVAAKLVSQASRADPKIQGRSFFYRISDDSSGLLPGMNVVMLLPVGEPAPGVLVPASAVVWLQGKPWAYTQVKPDRFARREVSSDQPVKDGWVQPMDFSGGEPVVIHGAQVLLSEEFRAQISVAD